MRTAVIVFASLLLSGAALAQSPGPTILQPAPGATVGSPVTIVVAPAAAGDMGGMPGMAMSHHAGHLHLIIDSPLPRPGSIIPMDARHIHLMHGETRTTVALPPGPHTIQLIEGSMSHRVADAAPHSDPVTFTVK
jgi:hypothetical protein